MFLSCCMGRGRCNAGAHTQGIGGLRGRGVHKFCFIWVGEVRECVCVCVCVKERGGERLCV